MRTGDLNNSHEKRLKLFLVGMEVRDPLAWSQAAVYRRKRGTEDTHMQLTFRVFVNCSVTPTKRYKKRDARTSVVMYTYIYRSLQKKRKKRRPV